MIISYLIGLTRLLESSSFYKLTISKPNHDNSVCVSIIRTTSINQFIIRRHDSNKDQILELKLEDILNIINDYIKNGCSCIKIETHNEIISYQYLSGKWKISHQSIISNQLTSIKAFDESVIKESHELKMLLTELGITTEHGVIRQKQKDKYYQVCDFINIFIDSLKKAELLNKSHLTLWDAACGKSYLSFLLYYYFYHQLKLNAKFICIDINRKLIDRCINIKTILRYENMHFIAKNNIEAIKAGNNNDIDVLFSLHGCDTATDEAIAMGIQNNAKLIIVAPCCQRELSEQMKGDPNHILKGITKYPLLKERLADVVTDGIRSLILEAGGYSVKILKFVPSEITPKNLMIVANMVKKDNILEPLKSYKKIKEFFHLHPILEKLIPNIFYDQI